MARPVLAALTVLFCLTSLIQAQEAGGRERHLALAAGPLFISQRDEIASPLRYGGVAPFAEVVYVTQTHRRSLALRFGAAIGTLGSALTDGNDVPRQRTWRAWIETEYAHALSTAQSPTRWFLGARAAVEGTVIQHFYADPGGHVAGYLFLSAVLGPVVAVQRPMGAHGTMAAQLCVPVVALIARPYSSVLEIPGLGLHVRGATLNEFQAAQLRATYTIELQPGTGLIVGYRLAIESYRDAQSFRLASQGASVGAVLRLSGGA
jgi:hypothetical protein